MAERTRNAVRLALLLNAAGLLARVSREHATALERRFAEVGLTTQQAALLVHASRAPTSPTTLTDAVGADRAGMTRLLDRLEAKGMVRRRRSADDRRAIVIELTEAAQRLLPLLPPVFGQVNQQLFAGLTNEEIQSLAALCERMLANLTGTRASGSAT